jgi:hypothetical protein
MASPRHTPTFPPNVDPDTGPQPTISQARHDHQQVDDDPQSAKVVPTSQGYDMHIPPKIEEGIEPD